MRGQRAAALKEGACPFDGTIAVGGRAATGTGHGTIAVGGRAATGTDHTDIR